MVADITGIPALIAALAALGFVYALLSMALNLQWGHTGLFNAGIAAFWAVGAYTTAILITPPAPRIPGIAPGHLGGFSWPWLAAVPVAALVAGVAGLLIAIPTLRLRTDYLAIATLGLGEVIRRYILNDEPVTGGSYGIYSIPSLSKFFGEGGLGWPSGWVGLWITLVAGLFVLVTYVVLWYLGRSPWARALKSIREDEDAAEVLGKDTFQFKLQSFVLGCAIMGISGSLYTVIVGFIDPLTTFAPQVTFTIWAMLILGGTGNYKGAIVGAFVFYGIDRASTVIQANLSTSAGIPTAAPLLALGATLALVILPFLAVDLALYFLFFLPRWRKARKPLRERIASLSSWIAGEAIAAWALYYSLQHPNYLLNEIVYFRVIIVGFLLILFVVFRPQGLLREKLVTVRRRST